MGDDDMTKMFDVKGKRVPTWNPITGCHHGCIYCWARPLSRRLQTQRVRKYKFCGFAPQLHEHELKRRFKANELYFVSDMGDMFGDWVPDEWILKVIDVVRRNPDTEFLFLTKNPKRYFEYVRTFPSNVILGATIETDEYPNWHNYTRYLTPRLIIGPIDAPPRPMTHAPAPYKRIQAMMDIKRHRKMVSIEPIIDFSDEFPSLIERIEPEFVYVGYDNYDHHLPEPTLEKTERFIEKLRKFTDIRIKTLRRAWYE